MNQKTELQQGQVSMRRILYVYGYGGSHLSRSVEKLRNALTAERYEVLCFDYPQQDCAAALCSLKQIILEHKIDVVMGSSLGAFLSLCLDVNIPKIVANPCLIPSVELPKLKTLPGKPVPSPELVATYAPFEASVFDHLPQGSHCFMAEQDELLGTRYLSAMQQHLPTTLIPGGHRLSDEAVQLIAEWLTKNNND